MQKYLPFFVLLFVCQLFSLHAAAQRKYKITGKIGLAANGQTVYVPLIGVCVSQSSICTSTRNDGSFTLTVPEEMLGRKLQITYTGYAQGTVQIPEGQNWNLSVNGYEVSGSTELVPEPIKDSDGDGVPDDTDKCPNEPGPKTNNGCPVTDEMNVRKFPIPYPRATGVYVLPWNECKIEGERTFKKVESKLLQAMKSAGYNEKSYYYIPHGFALVTQIEQVEEDGTPKNGDERWSVKPGKPSSFSDYLSSIFKASAGYFRVIAFLVTDITLSAQSKPASQDEAQNWVKNGYASLPPEYDRMLFTPDHKITVLVYQYKKLKGKEPELIQQGVPAREQLQRSQLAVYLQK